MCVHVCVYACVRAAVVYVIICVLYTCVRAHTHTHSLSRARLFADMHGLNIQRFDKRVGTITKTGAHSEKYFG